MVTSLDQYLSSWRSNDDPLKGDFTYAHNPSGYPKPLWVAWLWSFNPSHGMAFDLVGFLNWGMLTQPHMSRNK